MLLALMAAFLLFSMLMCYEGFQEKAYIRQVIEQNQGVKTIDSTIRKFKLYYGGKGGEVGKIKVKDFKKWIELGKVSDAEAVHFKKDNNISIEIYPPRNGLIVRDYIVNHTVCALSIRVNGEVLRSEAQAKEKLESNIFWLMSMSIAYFVLAGLGTYVIARIPIKK